MSNRKNSGFWRLAGDDDGDSPSGDDASGDDGRPEQQPPAKTLAWSALTSLGQEGGARPEEEDIKVGRTHSEDTSAGKTHCGEHSLLDKRHKGPEKN